MNSTRFKTPRQMDVQGVQGQYFFMGEGVSRGFDIILVGTIKLNIKFMENVKINPNTFESNVNVINHCLFHIIDHLFT